MVIPDLYIGILLGVVITLIVMVIFGAMMGGEKPTYDPYKPPEA